MATLVVFHAHPDDEAIATGGTMLRASREGHRVVLVVATRGEVGEVADGFLDEGETLADRRTQEVLDAAAILGVHRVEFLDYHDSGMEGEPSNGFVDCFWQADVDEAADRLADLIADETVDVFTCYDDHGGYGHPDHIQVHRVGHRFAQRVGVPRVYESTMNRDQIIEMQAAAGDDFDPDLDFDTASFGSPADIITTAVDVTSVIDEKRAAMAAHESQIDDASFFMTMPSEQFAGAFGTEWFIRTDTTPLHRESWLFDGAAVVGAGER